MVLDSQAGTTEPRHRELPWHSESQVAGLVTGRGPELGLLKLKLLLKWR